MESERTFGYVRVSTKEQNDDRQMTAMLDFGIKPENIFRDKQSGKNFDRPAYRKLIAVLEPGDILVIKSIDRLGRNYAEILEQWRYITKELHVAIVVLDLPILDTRQKNQLDLTGTLIADIVLTLLSYVAETERVNIRQRQLEGIAAAKRKGIRFGRPSKPKPNGFERVFKAWSEKQISARLAAAELGTSHQTFLKWCENS
jgi:DNA invertase Pin-like site-specific DNA recombinase